MIGGGFNGPAPTTPGDLTTVPAVVTCSYPTPPSSAAGYTAWTVSGSAASGAGATVQVFDYADTRVPVPARMYAKRERVYRSLGYEFGGMPEASEDENGSESGTFMWPEPV